GVDLRHPSGMQGQHRRAIALRFEPAIDHQPGDGGGDKQAVAGAAGAEGSKTETHGGLLVGASYKGMVRAESGSDIPSRPQRSKPRLVLKVLRAPRPLFRELSNDSIIAGRLVHVVPDGI